VFFLVKNGGVKSLNQLFNDLRSQNTSVVAYAGLCLASAGYFAPLEILRTTVLLFGAQVFA